MATNGSDYELIVDTLSKMDPETRHHIIVSMILISKMPDSVAIRFLADLALQGQLKRLGHPLWIQGL